MITNPIIIDIRVIRISKRVTKTINGYLINPGRFLVLINSILPSKINSNNSSITTSNIPMSPPYQSVILI